MRLDAVFVLAPKPKPPSIPTRRAFLVAGCAFVGGTVVGGSAVHLLGKAPAIQPIDRPPAPEDPILVWLRMLVDDRTPIGELIGSADKFVFHLDLHYHDQEDLWAGVTRLAHAIDADASLPNRRLLARMVVNVVQGHGRSRQLGDELTSRLLAIR